MQENAAGVDEKSSRLKKGEGIEVEADSGASTPRPLTQSKDGTTLETQQPRHGSIARLPSFWQNLLLPTPEDIDPSPPPDGGMTAWGVVLMSHFAGFNTFGFLNAYGVLQQHYTLSLNLPPSTVSWIGSLQAFLLFFVSAFSGRVTDAGYFHQTLFIGSVLYLGGMFALASSTTYWQFLLSQGVAVGIGGGLVFCPTLSLVGTYFSKRRSLALSICAIGNSLGGLIFATILQSMMPRVGFAWAMRTCAFVVAASLVPANLVLRPRGIKRTRQSVIDWDAFKEPIYACFSIGMFTCMCAMYVILTIKPIFYLGSFGRDVIGISTKDASSLLLLINGVGVLGRIIPAFVASRFGPLNIMVPLSLISGLILYSWAGVKTYREILVFDVFYGFIMAAAQGMLPPSLGSLTDDLSKMGVRIGMVFSICGFAVLIGNPVAGALIQVDNGGYLYAQIFSGTVMTVGVCFLAAARVLKTGWVVFVKV